jgi:hypothetical protein
MELHALLEMSQWMQTADTCRMAHLCGTTTCGPPSAPASGSLAAFLTLRRRLSGGWGRQAAGFRL